MSSRRLKQIEPPRSRPQIKIKQKKQCKNTRILLLQVLLGGKKKKKLLLLHCSYNKQEATTRRSLKRSKLAQRTRRKRAKPRDKEADASSNKFVPACFKRRKLNPRNGDKDPSPASNAAAEAAQTRQQQRQSWSSCSSRPENHQLGLLLFSSVPAHFSSMDSVIELDNDQSSVFSSYLKGEGGRGGKRACVKCFGFETCKKN